jgi:DNA-binding transcriptional LysR family regulator
MVLIAHPKHPLTKVKGLIDVGRLVAEPIVMNELTVGYGQVVMSLFNDIGTRPNILAVADNIETMKAIVQSGAGIAIVPRPCADNEVALGVLKTMPIMPARSIALSLFRRRQPLSRRKETFLSALREALKH